MKHRSFLGVLIAGLLMMFSAMVQAQDFSYTIDNDTIIITGYLGTNSAVIIPRTINDLPVTGIGLWTQGAFSNCTNLTSVTIPDSVTSIGANAFARCTSLTDVVIPNSVTSIGMSAFNSCASLTNVTIPDSVISIGFWAFSACDDLTAINVDAANASYSSINGILFNKDMTILIQCPAGIAGIFTIPNSVTNIGDSAFSSCHRLTEIEIPNSVISIEEFAFVRCTSLIGVYFKGNAPSLSSFSEDHKEVFMFSDNATVYYLPETTGWTNTLAGRPTVLWNPRIQTSEESFGIQNNRFGFNITGTNAFVVVVEACTNLISGVWEPLQTNILTNGSAQFNDPQWSNYPGRFYRLRMP